VRVSADQGNGWMLHSDGRRFGPLSEDELRGYFRAGMVKSVDRISAPGDARMRAAGEVALELGEAPPAGPPPAVAAASPPTPVDATAAAAEAERQQRAARAIAAMQIDLASMSPAASGPGSRGWLVPVVLVAVLIGALFFGLNMLKKMSGGAKPVATAGMASMATPETGFPGEASAAPPSAAATPAGDIGPRPLQAPGGSAGPVGAEAQDSFQRADDLMRAGNWAGLVAHARAWAQAQPERNEPLQFLGVAYARLGDYNAAADALNRVIARDPAHSGARLLLADTYLQSKRFQEAAGIYRGLVAQEPANARMWNNYGTALNGIGQSAQAVAALETAVKLDPAFKQAWANLGNTYQAMGDSVRAAAAFANAR
jgi:tetratricopeptide (TPR) repeat protein